MIYNIKFSCGHEAFTQIYGTEKERQQKIKYFQNNVVCPDCREKERFSIPLEYHIFVLPEVDNKTGNIMIFGWFTGDTLSTKDRIKEIGGYTWNLHRDNGCPQRRCWGKLFPEKDLLSELEKAEKIGSKFSGSTKLFKIDNYNTAVKNRIDWFAKRDKIAALRKPERPDVLENYRWNGKIYGKAGYHFIYLHDERIDISEGDADELIEYLEKLTKYKAARDMILNS